MSDDGDEIERREHEQRYGLRLTLDELRDILVQHHATNCGHCGTSNFTVEPITKGSDIAFLGGYVTPDLGIISTGYPIICQTCGTSRLISAEIVRSWVSNG